MSSGPGAERVLEITPQDGGHLVLVDGLPQSHVDLADPRRITFDYVRRAADVLDAHAPVGEPLRVVHVGGAGMTLARYVAATRPRSPQVVIEPDSALISLVRAELPLPPRSGIKVREVDGRSGTAALPDGRANAVVLDAYDEGRVPPELLTSQALADVARVLRPDGVALLNLSDRAPFPLVRSVVAGLRPVLAHVLVGVEPATQRGRRAGNLLVVAAAAEEVTAAWRDRSATAEAPYRVLEEVAVASSFGGGRAASDRDLPTERVSRWWTRQGMLAR